jgi:hypothetical protein
MSEVTNAIICGFSGNFHQLPISDSSKENRNTFVFSLFFKRFLANDCMDESVKVLFIIENLSKPTDVIANVKAVQRILFHS